MMIVLKMVVVMIVLMMVVMMVVMLMKTTKRMKMTPQLAVLICGRVVLGVSVAEGVVDGLASVLVEGRRVREI